MASTTSAMDDNTKPVLQLANPNALSASTIKVIWASQLFNITLEKVVTHYNNTDEGKHQTALRSTLRSSDGDDDNNTRIVSGGGNAMALAVQYAACTASTNVTPFYFQSCFVDEWCEWERTVLRPAICNEKLLVTAYQHLNHVLTSAGHVSPIHLVGAHVTVADVCVMTTLAMAKTTVEMPTGVALYYKSHICAFDHAVQAAQAIEKMQPPSTTVVVGKGIDDVNSPSLTTTSSLVPSDEMMKDPCLVNVVSWIFETAVRQLYGNDIQLPEHIVKTCQNAKHGDYQCSAAMPVFAALKKMGKKDGPKSPQDVAKAIIEVIGTDHNVIMNCIVQGPGFVVCQLRPSFLQGHVIQLLQSQKLPMPKFAGVCVVDFSSPNVAKEMHVGHLRSTIIGESVCRILESAGYAVHRINHVGDWGTQFGMLIQYMKEEYPDALKHEGELPNITDLTAFYKHAKERFDADPDFKKLSQLNVVDLQSHSPECIQIWKMLCDVSRREFQKVYQRLDVSCQEFGESFYNDKIPAVIDEFMTAGKITIDPEGGAKCVFVDKFPSPLMLQKSDGGYGYDSTDMTALKYRLQVLKADRIIVITDFTQSDHFKMVYGAGRDIGWVNSGQQLEHIGFGTVQGEDGKRFRTRSGDTVRLVDLLDEAVTRMEATLRERIKQNKEQQQQQKSNSNVNITETVDMSDEEIHQVAEAIGYGAVKYFDLRRNPTSNYKFSYDQMLSTVGDTAVYLLYARVRLDSIINKATGAEYNININDLLEEIKTNTEVLQITEESERNLVFQLQQFADTMITTLTDLYPYHICEYVYKLATAASDFVTQCRVLDATNVPIMKSRLLLCSATSTAMHQCFDLLGIRHVKRI